MEELAEREARLEAEREMPKPTIWPAALAAGLVAAAFGMLTVGIFFYVGAALVIVAIAGWMRDLVSSSEFRVSSSVDANPEPETRNPEPNAPEAR